MSVNFDITETCPVCGGDGIRPVWEGEIDGEGNPIPTDGPCPSCTDGIRLIGVIDLEPITEVLDDIVDKCNDIMDKCNDIFEQVSE